ncbi:MAG TPA: peptidase M20 family protein [Acidimicrobiaceae bacterium]|nr:peptidase M20 family protein [Acidimicrobiaceae bacterium]
MATAGTIAPNRSTELLQQMIRLGCVNTGHADSGFETRAADLVRPLVELPGVEVEQFGPTPERQSLIARLPGTDPTAPTLLLLGHTDVVPVDPADWRHDPFGGELIDGWVWGRGAIDMLCVTASMAVAFADLARRDHALPGSVVFAAVADEEAGGELGADWLLRNHRDAVMADYVLTECGGTPLHTPSGMKLPVLVAEKGAAWCTLTVHGTAGHGSTPIIGDNALVKAAEVVRRLATYRPLGVIHDTWRAYVAAMGFEAELEAILLDPAAIADWAAHHHDRGFAADCHACTHLTLSPNVLRADGKTNTIPGRVELEVDIRTLPGQTQGHVREILLDLLGDLASSVEIEFMADAWEATASPVASPLWHAVERASARVYPDARCVPAITPGGTDARFYRREGATSYGYGLFSRELTFDDYVAMFHAANERVDVHSMALMETLWSDIAVDLLGG